MSGITTNDFIVKNWLSQRQITQIASSATERVSGVCAARGGADNGIIGSRRGVSIMCQR